MTNTYIPTPLYFFPSLFCVTIEYYDDTKTKIKGFTIISITENAIRNLNSENKCFSSKPFSTKCDAENYLNSILSDEDRYFFMIRPNWKFIPDRWYFRSDSTK